MPIDQNMFSVYVMHSYWLVCIERTTLASHFIVLINHWAIYRDWSVNHWAIYRDWYVNHSAIYRDWSVNNLKLYQTFSEITKLCVFPFIVYLFPLTEILSRNSSINLAALATITSCLYSFWISVGISPLAKKTQPLSFFWLSINKSLCLEQIWI